MEIRVGASKEQADAARDARVANGAVEISQSALLVALQHSREEKEKAIDAKEFEEAAEWRDQEKKIIIGLARLGLDRPEN